MMHPKTNLSRRNILRAGIALPTIVPASALGFGPQKPASERITFGIIGLGSRGFNLLDGLLRLPDVQIAAICDVDSLHYRDRKWGVGQSFGLEPARRKIDQHYQSHQGVATTSDFREICARDDLDAIVVATPDHWHALSTLESLGNGKDVYCEKPVTHTFQEGQLVYREVARRKAVFQTGSQQRSDANFRRAVELVRNGRLGRIQKVEVGLPPGYDQPQGDVRVSAAPEHLDYEFWTGPAPLMPYMRARSHRWWRGNRAYGGGVLMDWIGHHNDIAHWALGIDESGPVKVEALNWTFPETVVYDTPHHYEIRCDYASGATSSISSRHALGTKFIGDEGWVFVTRGRLEASDPRWIQRDREPGSQKVYESNDHLRNFVDCVKSRRACIAPAETAHRSITPGHLGFVSAALGRPLRWDPEQELVIDDEPANQLLQENDYRSPWG